MYLRKFRRRKDGKVHTYWGLVESFRLAGKPRQRLVASLGELSDAQCAPYAELVRRLNRTIRGQDSQPDLFDDAPSVEVVPGRVSVERVLDFGDAWMGVMLWQLLGLDVFFQEQVRQGRAAVSWSKMIAWSVIARFCGGSSELSMAEGLCDRSALCDLLGVDPQRVNDDRLYRTLDRFLEHKSALMKHLSQRYRDLFNSDQDLVLYDLTSTFFEGVAAGNAKAQRGYSRDGRPDAKQVVIALVVTREGLPLACEVFRGNRNDSTTLRTICTVMEKRFGQMHRVWVMDRGIASEENLAWLRSRGGSYLVGTPKSQLRRFEKPLLEGTWRQVQPGVEVMLVEDPDAGDDTYVLCRSSDRSEKEKAMLERFAKRLEQGLEQLAQACARKSGPLRDPLTLGRRLGVLLTRNSRARSLFDIKVTEHDDGRLELVWKRSPQPSWAQRTAGHYMLRASLPSPLSPEEQWRAYIQLTEIEAAFRCLKTDLGVRPIHHQIARRVCAHIQICFLALCLRRTLQLRLEQWGLGRGISKLLDELKHWKQMDVIMPIARSDKTLRRRIIATPQQPLKILLQRLLMHPPHMSQPVPKTGICSEDFCHFQDLSPVLSVPPSRQLRNLG